MSGSGWGVNVARVTVVGAGIGGLVAALELAHRGLEVRVLERAARPGGKVRAERVDGLSIDAGPTVFTMRWVFEELFNDLDDSLDDRLALRRVERLARHAWPGSPSLDLFADVGRSADAVGAVCGAREAQRLRRFCKRAQQTYAALQEPFIRVSRPSLGRLLRHHARGGLRQLWRIRPFMRMASILAKEFKDPRLRQLFGRYATYCGSSPHLAPATLMLIAHVEQQGVWLVEGGMVRIVDSLVQMAKRRGVQFEYRAEVRRLVAEGGRVAAVDCSGDRRLATDAVVLNADVAALGEGLFGPAARNAVRPVPRSSRSLSAVTWAMRAKPSGFPLIRHNVFFSDRPGSEFHDVFDRGLLPAAPTVYVCAQDRDDCGSGANAPERLFCLVNAPAAGDSRPPGTPELSGCELSRCETAAFELLNRCGLALAGAADPVVTTPADFARRFPGTGGALYGRASHGWRASFQRPGSRTALAGLYLAGGSAHPGPGVPMAALSGRQAAACLMADLDSTSASRTTAMPGGTSTA